MNQYEVFKGDIVTNPPFRFAKQFIEKAISLVEDGRLVCMFLPINYLSGVKRRRLFDQYPPRRVWAASKRIEVGKNGHFTKNNNCMDFCWFVWEKAYKGKPEIGWFN